MEQDKTVKLFALNSAKALLCDHCDNPIVPFDNCLEGETEGIYHVACVVERYANRVGTTVLMLMYSSGDVKCSYCLEPISGPVITEFEGGIGNTRNYHPACRKQAIAEVRGIQEEARELIKSSNRAKLVV